MEQAYLECRSAHLSPCPVKDALPPSSYFSLCGGPHFVVFHELNSPNTEGEGCL